MSSVYVRQTVKDFIGDTFPSETLIDLTLDVHELRQLLADYNVQPGADWVGITFVADNEIPVSLSANNEVGLYRELGSFELHICTEARLGAADGILSRGEAFINAFRGKRLGAVVIDSLSPVNTERGATLEFDGGYVSGTVRVDYHRDLSPG